MRVVHDAEGWTLTSDVVLSDEEAKALSFYTAPSEVRLGEFVQIADPEGLRIGHVSSAVLHRYATGIVVCNVELM